MRERLIERANNSSSFKFAFATRLRRSVTIVSSLQLLRQTPARSVAPEPLNSIAVRHAWSAPGNATILHQVFLPIYLVNCSFLFCCRLY
ncbi:hypothetical protein VTI28DRAFT_4621 [Corynascus sepedonium]